VSFLHSERQNRRHSLPTDCLALSEDGMRLVGDRITDLSWDGAFVATRGEVRPGERLRLRIRIPESRVWVDARATVARVAQGRRAEDVAGAGLRITSMDGMSRILLATILRTCPEPASTARPQRDYARMVARIARGA
jgi:hypothetical protein